MPRWPNAILEGIFFVFPSEEAAKRGDALGGCGFFVSLPWESDPESRHAYAVTCKHVIRSETALYSIRAHKIGSTEPSFIECPRKSWAMSETDDLAALLISEGHGYLAEPFHRMKMTDRILVDYSLGIGNEVISPGRFIDLPGHMTNRPLVRSGTIAAPLEPFPIKPKGGPAQDSYVAEMRSRCGFSGSPVFVFIDSDFTRLVMPSDAEVYSEAIDKPLIKRFLFHGPWLLGVHCGEINVQGPELNPNLNKLADDQLKIELGSGMIAIVPCSRLEKLLMENEKLKNERNRIEEECKPQATLQSSDADESGSEQAVIPSHKAAFTRLLNVAARKREPEH